MFSFFITSFCALITIINPLVILPPFVSLTKNAKPEYVFATAWKACAIASGMLVAFALLGDRLLQAIGVSHGALMIAGGILLFTAGFNMITGEKDKDDNDQKKSHPSDVAVFPIGFPLIAGPAAISVVIANLAEVGGGIGYQFAMIASIFISISIVFICLLFSKPFLRLLGDASINILQRLIGLILAAIACQMVVSGIEKSVTEYKTTTSKNSVEFSNI